MHRSDRALTVETARAADILVRMRIDLPSATSRAMSTSVVFEGCSSQTGILIFPAWHPCFKFDSVGSPKCGTMGVMYMSAEVISMILVAAGVLITLGGGLFAGLVWVLRRMDERFDKVDERFEKVDARFEKIDERLSQVHSELNDVKVAVARLEGPQPRLIVPR